MTDTNKTLEGYAYVEGIIIPDYSKFQSAYYPFGDYKPFFGTYKNTGEFSYETQPIPTYTSTKDLIISNYDAPTKYTQVMLPTFEVINLDLITENEKFSIYNEFVFDSVINIGIREKNSNSNNDEVFGSFKQINNINYNYTITETQISKSNSDDVKHKFNIEVAQFTPTNNKNSLYAHYFSDDAKFVTKIIEIKIKTVNYFDNAINIINSSVGNLSTITNKMKLFYESLNLNTTINTLTDIKDSSKLYSESLNLNTTINTLTSIENILNTANTNDISLIAEITTLSVEEFAQTDIPS